MRVAIVDDDDLVRASTANLLRSAGLTPQTFTSAESFLETELGEYACVISDLQMPGITGLKLQEILLRRASGLPIIIVTAYPTEEFRTAAVNNGAIAFLGKPYDPDTLLELLNNLPQ